MHDRTAAGQMQFVSVLFSDAATCNGKSKRLLDATIISFERSLSPITYPIMAMRFYIVVQAQTLIKVTSSNICVLLNQDNV